MSNLMLYSASLCLSTCKTTALKEGKSFNLDPFPEVVEEEDEDEDKDNDSSQTNIIDEQLGRSIYLRELPPNAILTELEMGLKKFGPIMRYGIQARINEEGKHCAYVEFESATTKQFAIEASPIMIGDFPVILEQRLTGHTLGDCNRTQAVGSSSFGKNKLKNHVEVSRSMTRIFRLGCQISRWMLSQSLPMKTKTKTCFP